MRASQQEQTGGTGISEVVAAFQRLGWGPAINHQHDLGTDLFLQAREERGYDLGLIVGAQVKAGPSYFAEPEHDEAGGLTGWWFRDTDRRHIEHWLSHTVPHLIVLHDLETRVSYWQHVTEGAVVSTGTGARILVPKANVVDAAHRDALLDVASAGQPRVAWEGSVWMAGAAIPQVARLRHALIVPRLIAPHPNAGQQQPITPEQALAMLMQARLSEVRRFAEKFEDVPGPSEAADCDDWSWQFYGAFYAYATGKGLDLLRARLEDAPRPAARAAAAVATASPLVEDGRADEAVVLLDAVLERDDAEPVDQAWLSVQRARARAEIGHLHSGREDAVRAQASRTIAPNDATASAIAGAAAILLFNTSSWDERDLVKLITGADTAASWWRAQTTSRGLGAVVERSFRNWAQDTSLRIGGEDTAHNQLRAAALAVSHSGEQAGWRYLAALGATDELLRLGRGADPQAAADALDTLRLAGHDKDLVLAVKHLIADGPARAVTLAAAEVDLERSTRTTGKADLKLLQYAGDVLDPETATATIGRLLGLVRDPSPFANRTSSSYLLGDQLVRTLGRVVAAGGCRAQRGAIDCVLDQPPIAEQLPATSWARLVGAIPHDAWTAEQAARAGELADTHHDVLRRRLLSVAARHGDRDARSTLIEEAVGGSLDATAKLGEVRELPPEVVKAQVALLSEAATRIIADAQTGKHGFGSDVGHSLALLNVWHPDVANWQPLVDLLNDDAVGADAKRQALRLLSSHIEQIPESVQGQLRPITTRLATSEGTVVPGFFDDQRDASGEAALLSVALGADGVDAARLLITLLEGDAGDRVWAAEVAGLSAAADHLGLLIALSADPSPGVRAAAASSLARLATRDGSSPLALEALERCLADPGTWVAMRVAEALLDQSGAVADRLMQRLRGHPSAFVRQLAHRA